MIPVKSDSVTQAVLHRWFTYDPETGIFRWRERPRRAKTGAGDIAGSMQSNEHGKPRRVLWVSGKRIYASRAAYIYVHGDIPQTVLIDHIDGDTRNDRIVNLRIASAAQNTWNRVRQGRYLRGVSKSEKGRYRARIAVPGAGSIFLGTWDTEAEAHAAFMGAAAIVHGEFWTGHRAP